jgi:hypothetical protein
LDEDEGRMNRRCCRAFGGDPGKRKISCFSLEIARIFGVDWEVEFEMRIFGDGWEVEFEMRIISGGLKIIPIVNCSAAYSLVKNCLLDQSFPVSKSP